MLPTMPPPAAGAFASLRHPAFRALWIANLASNTGMWIQNTGASWLMTSLDSPPPTDRDGETRAAGFPT
jgi:Transmembrane secretion effector